MTHKKHAGRSGFLRAAGFTLRAAGAPHAPTLVHHTRPHAPQSGCTIRAAGCTLRASGCTIRAAGCTYGCPSVGAQVMSMPFGSRLVQENSGWRSTNGRSPPGKSNLFNLE